MISHLTTYEIALLLASMPSDMSAKRRGRVIDKSKTYVSTMLRTLDRAGPELKEAWQKGQICYDLVKDLAMKEPTEQAGAVAQYLQATLGIEGRKVRGLARKALKHGNETEKDPSAGATKDE